MKMTRLQREILARMANGAVITVDYERRWVLKQGNDVLREVSRPLRRTLRQNQWTHESFRDMAYHITDDGRAALHAAHSPVTPDSGPVAPQPVSEAAVAREGD